MNKMDPYTSYATKIEFDLKPLNVKMSKRPERFIIGVDPPFALEEKDGLEEALESLLGEDFFERNKFRLFLAVVIITFCLILSCFVLVLRKSCKKCVRPDDRKQRLRQMSRVSDKMLESGLGLPQETFQFMPLKALSPLSSSQGPDLSYEDQELPDYDQLQNRRIDPSKL